MSEEIQRQIDLLNVTSEELLENIDATLSGDYDESDLRHASIERAQVTEKTPAPSAEQVNQAIQKKAAEYPSGAPPLMKQTDMSEKIKKSLGSVGAAADDQYNIALSIVMDWSDSQKRGVSKLEQNCLATAILIQPNLTEEDFNMILLGHTIRGEHDLIESCNVMNSMQESLDQFIAQQRKFETTSNRLLDGVQSAFNQSLKAIPTPIPAHSSAVIPVKSNVIITPPPPPPPSGPQQMITADEDISDVLHLR